MEKLRRKIDEVTKQEGKAEPTLKMWFMSYFWSNITYTLAIQLTIVKYVKHAHIHCIIPIVAIFFVLLPSASQFSCLSWVYCLYFPIPLTWTFSLTQMFFREVNRANPTSLGMHIYFLWSSALSSPAHRVWPAGSPQLLASVLTAAVLPKVWLQEKLHSSSKSIHVTLISKTDSKQMLYFWGQLQSRYLLISLIM